jgi:hypothetical protein
MNAVSWTCSICAAEGTGSAAQCRECRSTVCSRCASSSASGICVNCELEDGERWFTPALGDADDRPPGRLPRQVPVSLIGLVLLPLLLWFVAEAMMRLNPEPVIDAPRRPVQFQVRPAR